MDYAGAAGPVLQCAAPSVAHVLSDHAERHCVIVQVALHDCHELFNICTVLHHAVIAAFIILHDLGCKLREWL